MTERLPTNLGDSGGWGTVLNGFLGVAHNTDGRLRYTYNVRDFGATGNGSTNDLQAFLDAFDEAEADGGGRVVYAPTGRYKIVGSLPLNGYSSVLRGDGAGHDGTNPHGTVLVGASQTGPVLDLNGWVWPSSYRGKAVFSDFAIEGDNTADATLAHTGISLATDAGSALGSIVLRNVVISETGGPCLDLGRVYLSDFEGITLIQPVSAGTNDVPWLRIKAANGNRFVGLGLRAMVTSNAVGVSGAIVATDDGTYPSKDNAFIAPWFENLYARTGGCLIGLKTNAYMISDAQWFDCYKETSATGTAFIRLQASGVGDAGGNRITGIIPGNGGTASEIDVGVDVQQSRNSVEGVKGYKYRNVQIASGVDYTTARLGGGYSGTTAHGSAFINNSAAANNYLADNMTGEGVQTVPNTVLPEDHNVVAWTGDVGAISTPTALGTAGTLYLIRVPLRRARSITNVIIYVGTAGTTLTSGQCFAALYAADGTLLGQSADQATSWGGTGVKTMALAGGPYVGQPPFVYAGLWFNGSVGPAPYRTGNLITQAANLGLSAPNLRYATANTGLTTTAPSTLGTQTATGVMYWAAVS